MEYKNPAVTVDILVLSIQKNTFEILLISRKNPPFQGHWAIPGGFVNIDETIEHAAKRELEEETSLKNLPLMPLQYFDAVERDPRGRTISLAYWTMTNKRREVQAGSDATHTQWFPLTNLPPLAFDHRQIIETLKKHLQKIFQNATWLTLVQDFKVQALLKSIEKIT
ncbi:MAG TPA: NUDIX hydrolase [Planctomycetota bacterium]|nr:NUDIX hydrolase [Planctomycetota bacterium]HRU51992.1 NUDIX hydrolase [Planctomycetota bacterium]